MCITYTDKVSDKESIPKGMVRVLLYMAHATQEMHLISRSAICAVIFILATFGLKMRYNKRP